MSEFLSRRKQEWKELEDLVAKTSRWGGVRRMTPEELNRLDILYRRTTVDLAQVRSRLRDPQLQLYLNSLLASAHCILYLPQRDALGKRAIKFVFGGFARCIARGWKFHLLSFLLMLGGVLAGYKASVSDPAATYALMPESEIRRLGAGREQLVEFLRSGREQSDGSKSFFAAFLFTNNFRVGMLSLASGVLAAIPTVLLIFYNGMILGVFTAVHHLNGIYAEYWAWVLPHGVTELGAIVLSGGAGLQLGKAVISPGRYSRTHSLILAGREAFGIVMGVGGMLLIAAIIESFVRQSYLTTTQRLIFAGATAIFWASYIFIGFILQKRADLKSDSLEQEHAALLAECHV